MPIRKLISSLSRRARRRRRELFRRLFDIGPQTRVLDLGSETGAHIHAVLEGTGVTPANVHIADIAEDLVREGQRLYGFTPVVIPESGRLPFPDNYFDIVFCSSVIEHVTVPKRDIWQTCSGRDFQTRATSRQAEFAREIMRLGKGFFVQTPYKWFPIESHTQLPFVGWLPRRLVVPVIRLSNRLWIKTTTPDWYLLSKRELAEMFPAVEDRARTLLRIDQIDHGRPSAGTQRTTTPRQCGAVARGYIRGRLNRPSNRNFGREPGYGARQQQRRRR